MADLAGLRDGIVLFVFTNVHPIAEPMPRRSPVADFVLIVCVKRSGIKSERLTDGHVVGTILVPDIPMNQAWLDAPPFSLQRKQQTWD